MREDIRVLYLNPKLSHQDSWIGIRARQFIQELGAAGAEVIPFPSPGSTHSSAGLLHRLKTWTKPFLSFFSVSRALFLLELYSMGCGLYRTLVDSLKIYLKFRNSGVDVVLARTMEYDGTPCLASRLLKCPLILEVHSPFHIERQLRGRRQSRFLKRLDLRLWESARFLWVISRELKSIMEGCGIPPGRIRVIPFGIRTQDSTVIKEAPPAGTLQVIFVGSFYPWHGVEILLEAFSEARTQIPDLRLCLVGDGIARPVIENRIRELGLEPWVQVTGWLQREQMLEHLNRSDIGVAPYIKLEPSYFLPVKIMDYMAAGLAIVASKQGSVIEMLEHDSTGLLVEPGDAQALARALVQLAKDPISRIHLGESARTQFARKYTLEHTARNVVELCREAGEKKIRNVNEPPGKLPEPFLIP